MSDGRRYLSGVKRVCVIGGGPSGLTTLRALIAERTFDEVALFERRHGIGGVWLFEPSVAREEQARIGQTGQNGEFPFVCESGRTTWPSPAYEGMSGNIAREMIAFTDLPWRSGDTISHGVTEKEKEDVHLFPSLDETIGYFRKYAAGLERYIRLSTEVTAVRRSSDGKAWCVKTRNWAKGLALGEESSSLWDAVVIASGIFNNPYVPDHTIHGMDSLPLSSVLHPRFYRAPQLFAGKKLLILGNGNSANDIAAQSAPVTQTPIYRSIRHPSYFAYLPDPRIVDVGPVARFDYGGNSNAKVSATLEDGTVIDGIDIVISATGYRYKIPYLKLPTTDPDHRGEEEITPSDGRRIPGLYKHIFNCDYPTLAFISHSIAWSTFSIAESQACVVARVFSGRLDLPSQEDMRADEAATVAQVGDMYLFHVLQLHKGGEAGYGQGLREWALSARPGESDRVGAEWDERRRWLLDNVVRLKTAQMKAVRDTGAVKEGFE